MTSACTKAIGKMKISFQKLENSDSEISSISSERPEEILPIILPSIPPFLVEEAKTQLGETDETRQKCLAEFRKLIEAEKKLVTPTDDLFLLAFLRSRKFNVKKAFKLLQNYWSFRREYKKIYDFIDIEPVRNLILRSFMGLLHLRDKNGCVMFVVKVGLWDPEIDSYDNLFRGITAVLAYTLEHPSSQIAGFRCIIDARGLSWKQLKYFTPGNLLLLIRSTQFCFPARYKGVHVLSENKMINFLWTMIYPVLTSKLKKRIFFHGEDLSPLMDYVHPSVLPEEFGGQAPRFENSKWVEIMEDSKDKLIEMLTYGYQD